MADIVGPPFTPRASRTPRARRLVCTLAIAMLVTSIEHVHVDGAVPSIAAWRDAGEIGKEYIEVGMGACDFPQTWAWDGHDDDESVPMRIDGAVTAEQRARFEPTALLAKHGLEKVAVGLSGEFQSLASFIAQMRSGESISNSSFAISSGSDSIGASEVLVGAPFSLAAGASARAVDRHADGGGDVAMPTERMFTVGGDGAGIVPHVDGAGYHALLHGHVLWIVVPPAGFLPDALRNAQGYALVGEVGLVRAEAHHEAKPYLLTCTQMPGTAVFLPRGWGRATVSLGDTLSLSVREVGWVMDGS